MVMINGLSAFRTNFVIMITSYFIALRLKLSYLVLLYRNLSLYLYYLLFMIEHCLLSFIIFIMLCQHFSTIYALKFT